MYQHDNEYEPIEHDLSSCQKEDGRIGLKEWLVYTNYHGRCRSTNNYCSLSKHDQLVFRNQMKGIFHHILHQFAQNSADLVWDHIIDDETKRPNSTKNGYVIRKAKRFTQD